MTRAHFHVVFMKDWCVYSSSGKQCLRSANHKQQNSKHNNWLEILAGEDFAPRLPWRKPKFIASREDDDNKKPRSREKIADTAKTTSSTQRPQRCTEAAKKYYNYTANETDEEREHRLPTLQKRWGDQATLKVKFTVRKIIFFDATIASNSHMIYTMHVKNIFLTHWGEAISLYTISIRFYSKLYFSMNRW